MNKIQSFQNSFCHNGQFYYTIFGDLKYLFACQSFAMLERKLETGGPGQGNVQSKFEVI